jgi:hypothetical protein
MITEEILIDEALPQVAEKCAEAIIAVLLFRYLLNVD